MILTAEKNAVLGERPVPVQVVHTNRTRIALGLNPILRLSNDTAETLCSDWNLNRMPPHYAINRCVLQNIQYIGQQVLLVIAPHLKTPVQSGTELCGSTRYAVAEMCESKTYLLF
jgi:hypothetical protein